MPLNKETKPKSSNFDSSVHNAFCYFFHVSFFCFFAHDIIFYLFTFRFLMVRNLLSLADRSRLYSVESEWLLSRGIQFTCQLWSSFPSIINNLLSIIKCLSSAAVVTFDTLTLFLSTWTLVSVFIWNILPNV